MRSFSKLKALCAWPAEIEKPSPRRDDAAALGTLFHERAERWALSFDGAMDYSGVPEPVAGWLRRLVKSWTPPPGLECEVPLGLRDAPWPAYVPVREPRPHEYEPIDKDEVLMTAGRADWVWPGVALNVCDVKTGAYYLGPPEQIRQVLAQGFAAAERACVRSFRPGIYYARVGLFDWGPVLEKGKPEWEKAWEAVVTAAKLPKKPLPGAWCLTCFSKRDCREAPEGA